MKHCLEARNLQARRDARVLFDNLSFCLRSGQGLQIEGPNGAGKTTLLRMMCGLTHPEEGTVCWDDMPIQRCRSDYHARLLYLGHQPGLKEALTVQDNLHCALALEDQAVVQEPFDHALEQVGLYGYELNPVRTLSAGQRRRVALARLWLSDCPLWLLDEPLTAIDRAGVQRLEAQLRAHLDRGGLLILTSHQPVDLPLERLQLG